MDTWKRELGLYQISEPDELGAEDARTGDQSVNTLQAAIGQLTAAEQEYREAVDSGFSRVCNEAALRALHLWGQGEWVELEKHYALMGQMRDELMRGLALRRSKLVHSNTSVPPALLERVKRCPRCEGRFAVRDNFGVTWHKKARKWYPSAYCNDCTPKYQAERLKRHRAEMRARDDRATEVEQLLLLLKRLNLDHGVRSNLQERTARPKGGAARDC